MTDSRTSNQRDAFEQWAGGNHWNTRRNPYNREMYQSDYTQYGWWAWKAASAADEPCPSHSHPSCPVCNPDKTVPELNRASQPPVHIPIPLELAKRFHESYERLSAAFGYETRPETRVFDPESPNGKLMIAVCTEILRASQPPAPALDRYSIEMEGDICGAVKVEKLDPNGEWVLYEDIAPYLRPAPARCGPDTPDNSMVICPTCTSQFGAISVADQAERRELREHIAWAWSIIANVSGGDWDKQSSIWSEAARAWEKARNPYDGLSRPALEKYMGLRRTLTKSAEGG